MVLTITNYMHFCIGPMKYRDAYSFLSVEINSFHFRSISHFQGSHMYTHSIPMLLHEVPISC